LCERQYKLKKIRNNTVIIPSGRPDRVSGCILSDRSKGCGYLAATDLLCGWLEMETVAPSTDRSFVRLTGKDNNCANVIKMLFF
jgi:hypothetical protein